MAVVRLDLNNVCRHAAFYDLEGVKWVRNGYELKLKVAKSKKVKLSRYSESEVSPVPEFREISRIREFSENSTENGTAFLCYFQTDTLA